MTDASGNIVQRYSYEAFGKLTASDPTVDNFYTYTGREYDKETGLYYYRARYYDAMEGRFISKDPIGFRSGTTNLYSYVGNSSVNFIDPWGLLKVHLWRHTGSGPNDRWGHASMTLANGTHISWWPQSQNRRPRQEFKKVHCQYESQKSGSVQKNFTFQQIDTRRGKCKTINKTLPPKNIQRLTTQ